MDRFAPPSGINLELHFKVKAVMTSCASSASSGRRLAGPDVRQVVEVVTTQPLSMNACQQKSAKACAKKKSCIWTTNPTQVPAKPTCVAKSSVKNWACQNILDSAACRMNTACGFRNKKCALKPQKTSKTG
jgi:hypothetical protein